ncbi:MAG: hypothetical protein FWF92_07625 [Oscillospiraceae bacterium]|nr:hypothetical protein [Oscillospiraceae bacterium]
MKTVYERINDLQPRQVIFCDFDATLYFHEKDEPNTPLIEALIIAQKRGVFVCLWTSANRSETIKRVKYIREYGLEFDEVYYNIIKGDLIIDNLAINP